LIRTAGEPRPELALSTEPAAPDIRLGPVSAHVALAFNMRAELNEARLRVNATIWNWFEPATDCCPSWISSSHWGLRLCPVFR
jgi:hypothetical protein